MFIAFLTVVSSYRVDRRASIISVLVILILTDLMAVTIFSIYLVSSLIIWSLFIPGDRPVIYYAPEKWAQFPFQTFFFVLVFGNLITKGVGLVAPLPAILLAISKENGRAVERRLP